MKNKRSLSAAVTLTTIAALVHGTIAGCTNEIGPGDPDLPERMEVAVEASPESRSELGAARWVITSATSEEEGRGSVLLSVEDPSGTTLSRIAIDIADAEAGDLTVTLDGEAVDTAQDRESLSRILSFAHGDVERGGGEDLAYTGTNCSVESWVLITALAWVIAETIAIAAECTVIGLGCISAGSAYMAALAGAYAASIALDCCRKVPGSGCE